MLCLILCLNIRDITIITIKNIDYCSIIYNRISEAFNLLESAVLKNQGYIYKKYCLNFQCIQESFLLFLFSIYKMVDIIDICKSLKISIGTVMKNPGILKFVPDHLKTKKMYKHTVKKLPHLLRHVPDRYKTALSQICNKAILENDGRLKSVRDCYQSQ